MSGNGQENRNQKQGKCYLIGAGDLTVGELSVGDDDLVIAVDGGLGYCGVLQLEPDRIIGDFDSLTDGERQALEQLKLQIPDRIITLPCVKDDTDMLAAIRHGLSLGYRDFRIYGGTGGRLDHTFANIQCLLYLKNHDAAGYLIDGEGMIFVIRNEAIHLNAGLSGTLSLFCLGQKARGVTVRNMKYTLEDYEMTNDFPIGVSNEFIGEEAMIAVEEGELVCMIRYAE